MKKKSLDVLGKKWGTDKNSDYHNYLVHYEKHLPDKCRYFLEIGVANGFSAMMFNEYFGEDEVDLHIIDLFINKEFVSPRWCRNMGFVPHIGSQTDYDFLRTVNVQAEVIEEDASHNCFDQIFTFKHCFINNLQGGGVYFMEDTHTSQPSEKFYWGEGVETFEDTPLWLFDNYLRTNKIVSKFFNEGESEVFESLIKSVHIEAEDKLIIIKKN